ncbi:MAG TPA: response regulator transcription factor [Candidatus Dormibacteraeota bacterium]|nr:response regulator transcription factor [Candidatus Dormibacteraeota bacterium]
MKVMIVDDNAEIRQLIRKLLGEVDNEFVECGDGSEAVSAYGRERPDWALMDVSMKQMDGLTATQLITTQFPGSRILVMTQHHEPKLSDRARAAGATEFLNKEHLIELRPLLRAERERNGDTTPMPAESN